MTLPAQLDAYRKRHDLTYQALALQFAQAGYRLDPSTLFNVCQVPDKPLAARTKEKISRFLEKSRNGGAARRKADR